MQLSGVLHLALLHLGLVLAHSWIERLEVTDASGAFVGAPGFPRGFSPRVEGFKDSDMTYLLPAAPAVDFQPTDLMCKSTQPFGNQTYQSPSLTASGGSTIVLRYQENGHVTLPYIPPGKPSPGTVTIYATTQSHNDDKFQDIHGVWTRDGSGGNGQGYLLNMTTFDDGKCYSPTDSPITRAREQLFSHPADPE